MITGHVRGHLIEFAGRWVWVDTKEPVDDFRPCKRCNLPPTDEGYDACLGYISGATSACCGHGVETPIYQET